MECKYCVLIADSTGLKWMQGNTESEMKEKFLESRKGKKGNYTAWLFDEGYNIIYQSTNRTPETDTL